MPTDTTFSDQDEAALRFCLRVLKDDPTTSYKELRREARAAEGLSVRRTIWTAARKKLGLITEEPALRDRGPRRPSRTASDRRRQPPGGGEEPAPRSSPSGDASPGLRRTPRPDGRLPAWATPPEHQRPVVPGSGAPKTPSPVPRAPRTAPAPDAPPAGASTPFDDLLDPASGKPLLATPRRNSVDFCVEYLKTRTEASFQEVKSAGEREGFTVYPATFGRAQALLGIVEAESPLQEKRERPAPAPPRAALPARRKAPRRPGDPVDPVEGLQAFIGALTRIERDRDLLREAVRRMLKVVEQVLK